MQKVISIVLLLSLSRGGFAQDPQNPIRWNINVQKVANKTYEVHLKATINEGWHIYAQKQPKGSIGLPTTVKFITNPLLSFKGKPREIGKLEKVKNEELDMENHQYKNEVDFVQLITVKSNVKTNVAGSIEFMACTDERCLPPAIQKFNLVLN